jgi:hypothetical protein
MKEIRNRKRKREKKKKNREGPRGEPFGPDDEAARGPSSLTRIGTLFPLTLTDSRPHPSAPGHHLQSRTEKLAGDRAHAEISPPINSID